jgi:fimbrial chaperone protein
VSLEFLERELDLDGNLDNKAMVPCKDFLIYPSEVIIRPNERVKVQFTYRGKRKIKEDRAYFLFSKEVALPLEDEEDEGVRTNIQVLMNYYTIVVFQTGKEGKLEFVSSKAIDGGNIELIVENRGGGRVSTRNLAIKTGSDIIKNFTGTKNSIMPGQRRRFTFKYLRPLTSKEVKFIYDYSASN